MKQIRRIIFAWNQEVTFLQALVYIAINVDSTHETNNNNNLKYVDSNPCPRYPTGITNN